MLEFNKNGLVDGNLLLEYIVEPDGSTWEPIFYHSNPSAQLFSSSDSFSTGVVKSSQMFFNFNACNGLTNFWEFLVFQRPTADSSYVKYRWRQTNNPLATTSTSGVSTISGYSNAGGGFCRCNANTYIARTGTTDNWWQACGCWTAYNGGIPGMASVTVTTGDIAVFLKIDVPKTKIYPGAEIIVTNNLIQR